MKKILFMISLCCGLGAAAQPTTSDVWINEFHYDGLTVYGQSDQNEFIELIIRSSLYNNPTELAKLKVVLYTSGALDATALTLGRGKPYNAASPLYTQADTEYPLSSFQACSSPSIEFTMLYKPVNILQDVPAAIAIVYNNTTVVQLLSYEKQFKIAPAAAGGGPAAGLTTQLARKPNGQPAMENALSPNTHSVALIGAGFTYNTFVWNDGPTQTATPCAINTNQSFAAGAPLPVRWLNFTAAGSANRILVQWHTEEDAATQQYEVELSTDGSTFRRVATVAKDPSRNGKYGHSIDGLANGLYYLRIRAVDHDGRFQYTGTKKVKLSGDKHHLTVFPNPARETVTLQLLPAGRTGYSVSVIDASGRTVKQQALGNLQAGALNALPFSVQGLQPGTYRLRINGPSEELTTSLVIIQ